MKRTRIQKAAHAGRLVAAALVAAACIRFAAVAVATAVEEDQKPPTASAPQPTGSGGRDERPASTGSAQPSQANAPPAPPGEPIQVQLLVNVGTERSEVFVDGAKLGSSPFLGTISCKSGAKLDIEVVITKGVVYGYERTCAPGTIRVDAAP